MCPNPAHLSCIFAAFISKIKERNMKVSLDIRVFNWLLSVDIKKVASQSMKKRLIMLGIDTGYIISIIRIVKQSIRLHS